MFFSQDHSFHELFCVAIQLLNKTWKEMRATQEDFDKVGGMGTARPGVFWEGVLNAGSLLSLGGPR
jgi:hypothetical protein